MKWFYYGDNGKRVGPFSSAELRQLAQTGVILPSTTVEDETGKSAVAERVAGLFGASAISNLESRFQKLAEELATIDSNFSGTTRRVAALEMIISGARFGLTKRVDDLEKRGAASDETSPRALRDLEQNLVKANEDLTKRVDDLEKRGVETSRQALRLVAANDVLTTRVGELEKKSVSGDVAKRLDALEKSVGGARSGLTKRVGELEKKSVSGDVAKRLDNLEKRGDETSRRALRLVVDNDVLTKRVDALEKKSESGGASQRLDALEKSVGGARSGLTKRVGELEKKSESGDFAKRLEVVER